MTGLDRIEKASDIAGNRKLATCKFSGLIDHFAINVINHLVLCHCLFTPMKKHSERTEKIKIINSKYQEN